MLTLTVTASGFGQQNTDVVRIRTTGRERGEIQGQDLAGRTWTLRRVEKRNERQELRDTLQNLVDTSINSPIFCTMFAAMCHVIQASGYDLGLSTEQIKKVGQLDVDACNDVLRQLQQRGWLK